MSEATGSVRPAYIPPAPTGYDARTLLRGDAAMRIIAVLLFFGLWSVIAMLNANDRWFPAVLFPPPWSVIETGIDMLKTGELEIHIRDSMVRVGEGFVIGAVLAIGTGLIIGRWRLAEQFLETILEMLRPIPPLAFLPLLVLWLGIGETSKIAFIAYTVFFPVFTTTVEGIKYVDPVLIRAAASLGASDRDLFRHVILPAALPNIIVGLRLGFALAFFVIVAAEFVAADSGLGFLINDARTFFLVPRMLLGALVIGALGYFFNWLLKVAERKLIPYRKQTRGTGTV